MYLMFLLLPLVTIQLGDRLKLKIKLYRAKIDQPVGKLTTIIYLNLFVPLLMISVKMLMIRTIMMMMMMGYVTHTHKHTLTFSPTTRT